MAVSVQDQRMVQQLKESLVNVDKLTLSAASERVRDFIVAEVNRRLRAFQAAITVEDKEEIDVGQAGQAYADAHRVAVGVFRTMHAGLATGVALKLAGGEASADVNRLNSYLAKMSASDFASLSRAEALANFERTHGYLRSFLPNELFATIKPLADDALAQMRATEEVFKVDKAEWIQAQAELEKVRAEARTIYLAMRDTLSGLLRLSGMHHKLNQVVPPLTSVLNPNTRPQKTTEPLPDDLDPALTDPAPDPSITDHSPV